MKKAYLFLAYGFEEVEALTAVDLLRRADIEVTTVSVTGNDIVTGRSRIPVVADVKIDESSFCDANAVILPGGMPGVTNLENCEKLISVIKKQNEAGKLICAICAGPMIFAHLGLLKGKKATSYPTCIDESCGAILSEDSVCTDGNIVTSRGVGTAIDFALEIIRLLAGEAKAAEVKESILAK